MAKMKPANYFFTDNRWRKKNLFSIIAIFSPDVKDDLEIFCKVVQI
jgi:hypothetical protein